MIKIIFWLALSAVSCLAGVVYQNTTTDQQFSVFYSTGYTEIGDQLQLTSPSTLTSLDAQFYNDGADATFDAEVQFYYVGSPVGAEIGGPFTVTDTFIASNTSQTVSFLDLANIAVPEDVVVMLTVLNVSAGGDIGVNFFNPPTVGSSDDNFFIADDGTGAAQASTNLGIDNLYFAINGTPTPEPGTAVVGLAVIVMVGLRFARRRKSRETAG